MAEQPYTWANRAGRYRDPSTGRFVAEATVRAGVDALADASSARMAAHAARFRAGETTAAGWLTSHLQEVKAAHVAAALAAYGGREQMSAQRWGVVGQQIRVQYQYARAMVADAIEGRARLNGRLDVRAAQYGQAARHTYGVIRRRQGYERGEQWERNILGASEHCRDCVAETALGWVPIGTLSQPGTRQCHVNCRCRLESAERRPMEAMAS